MMWLYNFLSWINSLPKCDICGESRDIVRVEESTDGGILFCENCAVQSEEE